MSSSNVKTTAKGAIKNIPPPEGHKPSPYGRFIPREEISSFSAWSPDQIGGIEPVRGVRRHARPTEGAPGSGGGASSGGSAANGTAKTAADANNHPQDPNQLERNAHHKGYQDGYRDGLVALENFKQSYAMQVSTQMAALLESLGAQLEDLQQDMARTLAITATHLARQIVRSELHTHPDVVASVANESLESLLLSARHVTLRVHPDDLPLVNQGCSEMLNARGARVIADANLGRGSCMLESDIGVVDASLETRWRRAVASIGCSELWATQAHPEPLCDPEPTPVAAEPPELPAHPASPQPPAQGATALPPPAQDEP